MLKNELEENNVKEKPILTLEEREEIKNDLLKQAEIQENEDKEVIDLDVLTGPTEMETENKKTKIEYLGKLVEVDIDFTNLDEDLTNEEYQEIIKNIKILANTENQKGIVAARSVVEGYGDKALEIVFRQARQFDFRDNKRKSIAAELVGRLCLRSYKGRKLIVAILKEANVRQHLILAMLASGQVMEQEAIPYLIKLSKQPDLFQIAAESILKIRESSTVEPLLETIVSINPEDKDTLDCALELASEFNVFSNDVIPIVFDYFNKYSQFYLRPILGRILSSFEDEVIYYLEEELEKASQKNDYSKFLGICNHLGHMKKKKAVDILINSFYKYPSFKNAVIRGLSFVKDKRTKSIYIEILKDTRNESLIKECLVALAFIGDKSVINDIDHLLKSKREDLRLYTLFVMANYADKEALDEIIDGLVNGNRNEQDIISRQLLRKLKTASKIYVAENTLVLPEDKAFLIISAFRNLRWIPQKIGPILKKLLKKAELIPLRVEIYKLIAKHVNTKDELLPQSILYKNREKTQDEREKRMLDEIIRELRLNVKKIDTNR